MNNGPCVACLTPTDTALGVEGEAEWHMAFLVALDIPEDQAALTVSEATNNPPGKVPVGRFPQTVRVCASCVEKSDAPFPAPVLTLPGVDLPTIHQTSN